QIGDFLDAGDLLVINTSGTMNAALRVTRADGTPLELHLSTHLPADLWVVEVRIPQENATAPFYDVTVGETLTLPARGKATLLTPHLDDRSIPTTAQHRLWIAALSLPEPLQAYLTHYGFPIRYKYVHEQWPTEYYQSVYATEKGSAEMPSA